MSAVAHRAVSSPRTLRSQSVGRRPSGIGTTIRPWLAATSAPSPSRSAARSASQLGEGTTSSSRNATHSALARRHPAFRAAAGPAAARNAGWRRASAEWVAFLDDDVVPSPSWLADLAADLEGLGADVAASQGRIVVPMPEGRRPTDWERNVRGLETARWATAEMAYRRAVLVEVGGFDERFPRAYREDADLGLRVVGAGHRIVDGWRVVTHPVRPAGRLVSVRLQAGNADDVLMLGLHGAGWRARAGVPRGRRPRHLAV